MNRKMTGSEIRKSFIDFFTSKGHTFVPSSPLVPGGDQTLLFTNAGMVQFKDVFLGTDKRPYTRAANSQKCLRVAGKHNDLDDVGRDDTHHTFFEMLGNWSFGDYYKNEAIAWAWELLTEVWGLPKEDLWTTYFKDDLGNIPTDLEAAESWKKQAGITPDHILSSGRKDNFWEMADVGPCGPCSEIHVDLGEKLCSGEGHTCGVNVTGCTRFLEIWNLVFIQYNRISPDELEPLPAHHVDTGMGFERIVAILQNVDSNYKTDLFSSLFEKIQQLTGHTAGQRSENITPYRVISDHSRAAAFLIADGVTPGNTGRSYVCRMIIRRASRFGAKIGLKEPFLADIAGVVIDQYGEFFLELNRNRTTILEDITREEKRFHRTIDAGLSRLDELLTELKVNGGSTLTGAVAFDLYATLGLPFEITRDIAREQGLEVDQTGFQRAMADHRLVSGGGKAMGTMGGEGVDLYRSIFMEAQSQGKISPGGVEYDPYRQMEVEGSVLALIHEGSSVDQVEPGDVVDVLLPQTCFYVESGGQVADTGLIVSAREPRWEIQVTSTRRPIGEIVVHEGEVLRGNPKVGDIAIAAVDAQRRRDIMRNHTATHLLHAELHSILGEHARQAGSLVAPDRLRFDFNHSESLTAGQLEKIEEGVNRVILENHRLNISFKSLQRAMAEGATALFGEKYGEVVRTITIGGDEPFSYELCGGTHVNETGDIGTFLITSEGSTAAGIRRIEAVTGRKAFELIQKRFRILRETSHLLGTTPDDLADKAQSVLVDLERTRKQVLSYRQELVAAEFVKQLDNVPMIEGVPVLTSILPNADPDTLRQMTDLFRNRYPSGVIALASVVDGRPVIITAVTDDLVKRGIHAGELVKAAALKVGGSGGGKPSMAQAGGKDASHLPDAMRVIPEIVAEKLD